MAKINMTSLDVLTDEVFGREGTPKRGAMEKHLKEEVKVYLVASVYSKGYPTSHPKLIYR